MLGGIEGHHASNEVEHLLEFVGLGEIVQAPVAASRSPSDVRKGTRSNLGDRGPQSMQGDVAADQGHGVPKKRSGYILSVYTHAPWADEPTMKGRGVSGRMSEAGAIIVYRLPPHFPVARRVRFGEKVWGQVRRSKGRPSRRHGALESIPHWKVARGVVVVREKDGPTVVRELERWKAEVKSWPITLDPQDARELRRRLP